jgi:iron complex transport system substrate-binding protein
MKDLLAFRLSRRSALALGIATSTACSVAAIAAGINDAAGFSAEVKNPQRILTIGNAVTEIVFALGMGDKIVAVDTTSKSVPGAEKLPDIGYMRALSAEGILAQAPDLILATIDSGPKEVIATLRQSKVPVVQLPIEPTVDGILHKIDLVGTLLDHHAGAKAVSDKIRAQAEALKQLTDTTPKRPKTLFILGMGGGKITAGGKGTAADAILGLVGAENAASGLSGYNGISPEILIADPPDAIIVMANEGHEASMTRVKENPMLAETPAGKSGAIYAVDGAALLGFGTRSLDAASVLAKQLHG